MQVSFGLCFLEDLVYLKESKENAFLMVSFTRKKRHFATNGKKVKDINT